MTIKNASALSESEIESFRNAYLDYFRKYCIARKDNMPLNISRAIIKLRAKDYSDIMLERINNGMSTSYVAISGQFIEGFITGYAEEGMAHMSHLYVNSAKGPYRNRIALELYRSFATSMKRQGAALIKADSEREDFSLIDTLEALDFAPLEPLKATTSAPKKSETNPTVSYGKRI